MVGFAEKNSSKKFPWPVSKLFSRRSNASASNKRQSEWYLIEVSKSIQRIEDLCGRYEGCGTRKEQRLNLGKLDDEGKKLQKLRDRILSTAPSLSDSNIRDAFELIETYLVRIHELKTESRQLSSKASIAEMHKQYTPPDIVTISDSVGKLTIHETPNRAKHDQTSQPVKLPPDSDGAPISIETNTKTNRGPLYLNAHAKGDPTSDPQSVCESIENALQAIKARERIHMWLTSTQEQLTGKIGLLAQAIESHDNKNGNGEDDQLPDNLLKLHGLLRVCESDQRRLQELLGTLETLPSTADSFLDFVSDAKTMQAGVDKRVALVHKALHPGCSKQAAQACLSLDQKKKPTSGMSSKTAVALVTTHGTRIGINADTGKTSGKNIASACTSNVTETIATRSRSRATSGIPRPVCTTRISKLTPVKSTIGYTELEKLVANKVLEMRNQSKAQAPTKFPPTIDNRRTRLQHRRSATPQDAQLLLSRRRIIEKRETRNVGRCHKPSKVLPLNRTVIQEESSSSSLNDSNNDTYIVPLPMMAKPVNCVL